MRTVLGHLYMSCAVLKNFEDQERPPEDLPLVNWAMRDSLFLIQNRLINILRNFPIKWLGKLIKFVIFPLGHPYTEPSDNLGKRAARILITDNPARDRLTAGIHRSQNEDAAEKCIKATYKKVVGIDNYEALLTQALRDGIITDGEARLVRTAQQLSQQVIAVDSFSRKDVERKYAV